MSEIWDRPRRATPMRPERIAAFVLMLTLMLGAGGATALVVTLSGQLSAKLPQASLGR